ncbi:MAG: hypothetical protein F2796_01510 [Actinobacteria bacterium]|nr:hypothetical protein [Actinomycetota bacterium]
MPQHATLVATGVADVASGSIQGTRSTGMIEPERTATLQTAVAPGRYRLRLAGDAAAPAELLVGPERASSQNDLLLP